MEKFSFKSLFSPPAWFAKDKNLEVVKPDISAHSYSSGGTYSTIMTYSYDGEKNIGEIGPIKDYTIDYDGLRLRSWQAFLESEIAQTILKKFNVWIIGSGLKLQAEPQGKVLESEGIPAPDEEFNQIVEARFSTFANCQSADYSGMRTLHALADEAHLNAIVGGDVLVILRYIDNEIKVQLIDGAHVQNPMDTKMFTEANSKGNIIFRGVELSPTGEHVAYYIRKRGQLFASERIEVKGKTYGLTMAFMVYGLKYRLDSHRGMPLIAVVLETLKKLERYKEATVGSAEERQKIAYAITHGNNSTGESVLLDRMTRMRDVNQNSGQVPVSAEGNAMADKIAATTNKMAFNMPIDSDLKVLESKNELYFKDFYTVNIDIVCAAVGIPPNVAMSKYDSNFSASRAALKDWEHTINVSRKKFSTQFYQKVYDFWFEIEVLKNKIQAQGYMQARLKNNFYVVTGYRTARFIGPSVPHIDPVVEVQAERLKLGMSGANAPLTTVEKSTEALNGGDAIANMKQFADEITEGKRLKVIPELLDPNAGTPPNPGNKPKV